MSPLSQLDAILASIQSKSLVLRYMSLSEENTRALVTAMRDRVQIVRLWSDVWLDPELLADYDGQGQCTQLEVTHDTRDKYGTQVFQLRGWAVTEDTRYRLVLERK